MMNWMRRMVADARTRLGRTGPAPRAGRRGGRPGVEGLERREVLTAAAVHPFMILPAIAPGGQAAAVEFQLAPGAFTAGAGRTSILLALSTEPAPGAAATTAVTGLAGPGGQLYPAAGSGQAPMIFRVAAPGLAADSYSATVQNAGGADVAFGLDGSLAGDADGNQRVDARDLARIRASYGGVAGDARYSAAADVNGDGRVGLLDYNLALQNLGARASYIRTPAATTPTVVAPTPPVPAPAVAATPAAPAVSTGYIAAAPVATPVVVAPVAAVPQVIATQATAPPLAATPVALAPAAPAPNAPATAPAPTWSPQVAAFYPAAQYGAAVPSGPLYGGMPAAYYPAQTPAAAYYAPAAAAPAGYYTPAPQAIQTYSYTPNGTTPVYLTPMVQQSR